MRRIGVVIIVLVISLSVGSHDIRAMRPTCTETNCGVGCQVTGNFGGYCVKLATMTTGCVQLYGPDCASMEGAYCCRGLGSAF